ncbi:dihydrolipoyl dehydrogenase [bacterium]|nr:dihydrolipoyl dehydrogenase [bacterium]
MNDKYDVIVIGAGPGGYECAIRFAQLGKKTACIEKNNWGGTCLNIGCIPSKALLDASKHYAEITQLADQGITVDPSEVKLDFGRMMARKDAIVKRLTGGVKMLLEKNGVDVILGNASFKSPNEIEVELREGGKETLLAETIVIATGSDPMRLLFLNIDGINVVTSTEALALPEVPEKLLVVGGGYIGMEMACVYRRLGAEVTIVEILPSILTGLDPDIVKQAHRAFKKQGMKIFLEHKVTSVNVLGDKKGVEVAFVSKDGKEERRTVDIVLASTGRVPFTDGLALEKAGVELTDRGFVKVDDRLQTTAKGVYAIGDVIGGMMLAHKASHEGVALAEHLAAGEPAHFEAAIPFAVFTGPEIAGVGMTEFDARESGREIKVGTFSFKASGKAMALGEDYGMAKVIADASTDDLLGVHVIGPHASDLVSDATLALESKASLNAFQSHVRIHPSLAEVVKEAALNADGKAINRLN